MRFTDTYRFVYPSGDITNYLGKIASLAAAAKTIGETSLFNQAVSAYDQLVDRYNAANRPKEKGFWEKFRDNMSFQSDTTFFTPMQHLESDFTYRALLAFYKDKPYSSIVSEINNTLSSL